MAYLELVWIGCSQSLNTRFRQHDFINRLAPQESAHLRFQNPDFSRLQNIAKLCFFKNANWVTAIFFFIKSKSCQNDNRFSRNTYFIPSLCISLPKFSQSIYTPPCISATLFSQSPRALFCFVYGLCSSSRLLGNNSPFLFC